MAFMYYGKKYDTKAELKAAQKKAVGQGTIKKKGTFFEKFIEGSKSKKAKAAKASVKQGKANAGATAKMYAAESMFTSAKNRDTAKTTPGKAQSFGSAFKSAKASGKKIFSYKGKSYTTQTKSELEAGSKMGKFKKRFDQSAKDEPNKKSKISEFFSKLKKKK